MNDVTSNTLDSKLLTYQSIKVERIVITWQEDEEDCEKIMVASDNKVRSIVNAYDRYIWELRRYWEQTLWDEKQSGSYQTSKCVSCRCSRKRDACETMYDQPAQRVKIEWVKI